jgi:uncharacterized Zn finger protein
MEYDRWGYPRYVPVWEKRAKAEKKIAKLKKKNPGICPMVVQGRKLACTWWGKAWNTNLESYADYSNRIGRGRSYVRNGFVLDLKIGEGEVTALVQGTRPNPYRVTVKIKPLKKDVWDCIKKECSGKIESLQELLEGSFPEALSEMFTVQGRGLFPSPEDISFDCSCPDWASMCKHVAATLYGVGVKLDSDPKLFFILRKVEMEKLIRASLKDRSKDLLGKARKKTSRVIEGADADKIFGIALGKKAGKTQPPKNTGKRKKAGKKKSNR